MPDLAAGFLVAAAAAGATWWVLELPATFLVEVVLLYLALAAVLIVFLPGVLPGPGFGPANRVTLLRAALILPLAALLLNPGALDRTGRWWSVGLGIAVMVLDGFDGWVARRTGTGTRFGARFDMETDAFLMLVLSGLVWATDEVGPWVLLIGGMRYLFVVAGKLVPALRAPLYPSFRRKAVCVVQGAALLVCLGPVVPGRLAVTVAAVALALLLWSFGVDTRWLLRRREGVS